MQNTSAMPVTQWTPQIGNHYDGDVYSKGLYCISHFGAWPPSFTFCPDVCLDKLYKLFVVQLHHL